jgi:hypothetical protein
LKSIVPPFEIVIVLEPGCRVYAVERRCINITYDEWREQAITRFDRRS